MKEHKLFGMSFGKIYPLYLAKIERKGRSEEELLQVISWLTGYNRDEIFAVCDAKYTIKEFFHNAPEMNSNRDLITGTICGIKVQDIEDPLMKKIRQLDKIVDELAKGKTLEKIMGIPKPAKT